MNDQIHPAIADHSHGPYPCKHTAIDGKRLAYLDIGKGFPVLLGHSYLWDAHMWRPQIDMLSRHFRVIAPDLWGHGQSEAPPRGTRGIDDLAGHYIELLDTLGIDECHVAGLSVGGMWAAALAQRAPHRVRKLVLMDTFVGAEPDISRVKYMGMLARIERDRAVPQDLRDMIVPMFFSPWIDPESALYRGFSKALSSFTEDQLLESIVPLGRLIFGREDRLDRLRLLNAAQTLVVVGQSDIPRPVAEAVQMASIIGCPVETVANAGHISNLEKPEAVNQILLKFLMNGD